MCDSGTKYMLNAIPYIERATNTKGLPKGEYYVKELSQPIHGTNRNVTCDNWFTSIPLAKSLHEEPYKLTLFGTIRSNKQEIPEELKNTRSRRRRASNQKKAILQLPHVEKEENVKNELREMCPYQPHHDSGRNSSRTVPAKSDRRKLPRDVSEVIKAKNAILRRAGKYPTCENKSHAHALQQISPSHQAYWGLVKALKTEGAVPTPALRKPDKFIAFDDREKARCLADSMEHQCSENPPYDLEHVRRVEEEVRHRVSLPPKDDLDPITHDQISKHIKGLKIRKAPGRTTISSKALKCSSAPLVALLVAIFNACIQNCYFPTAWKEAVVVGIPKPGKPRDFLADYRPISLLSVLGSTLSPLLYSAYVNSIPRPSTVVQLALFADDTALYLRRAADAPLYVKNSVLHRNVELPTISKFMKDALERFFNIASNHPNPLLVSAVSYEPPPPHHFCRKPRNVLIDPPDDLTVEVEKLLELNKMVID
ncbi:RNA-directed DNA polymerase from mobile element jockey [Eumeta japonica]|uniref:RNA-directed DNA polymerase from mobile element jockey n=1 Tax=Eumeta variegata TaxID=151549 RepID=A0A4C1VZ25_EUMVA|nr:RNA-directed DNA polymerase from mobile element jockey [Eumeta japonica]